jgi:hypothetical protein
MDVGFVLGQHTEARLYEVEASLFPAAIHSQQALAAFTNRGGGHLNHYHFA